MNTKTIETDRILSITLKAGTNAPLSPALKHEQDKALKDIPLHQGQFIPHAPKGTTVQGPYALTLSIEEGYLVIRIKDAGQNDLPSLALSLTPYKRLIQDYFLMIDSYETARHAGQYGKLEAIDMGRRGLHNEGADLIRARLKDKITMDHETARKLFTLIGTLHKAHRQMVR